jgi:uncharacterized protein YecT (DUF1311 family)
MAGKKSSKPAVAKGKPVSKSPAKRASAPAVDETVAAPKEVKPKAARKTERINVWLQPEQVAWLKSRKNASETMRALVTEAMSMDALAQSVKAGRKKK